MRRASLSRLETTLVLQRRDDRLDEQLVGVLIVGREEVQDLTGVGHDRVHGAGWFKTRVSSAPGSTALTGAAPTLRKTRQSRRGMRAALRPHEPFPLLELESTMLKNAALVGLIGVVALACGKKDDAPSGGSTSITAASNARPVAAAAAAPDCEKVVEKIASLNPADSRGEPEKKMWRAMCAQMNADEKTCVMGAKALDDMGKCLKK